MKNIHSIVDIAIREAKKSTMTQTHGCVAFDSKSGEILSRGYNYFESSRVLLECRQRGYFEQCGGESTDGDGGWLSCQKAG